MADPTDLFAYDEIARLIPDDIQLAVVAEGDLLAAIDRIYRRTDDIHGLTEELARDMGESEASIIGLEALGEGQDDAPVVRLLQTLFEDALQVNASDLHIEPQENSWPSASASTACCIRRPRPISRLRRRWLCGSRSCPGWIFRKNACRRTAALRSRCAAVPSACACPPCRRNTANPW